jgi:hypothetical protein
MRLLEPKLSVSPEIANLDDIEKKIGGEKKMRRNMKDLQVHYSHTTSIYSKPYEQSSKRIQKYQVVDSA